MHKPEHCKHGLDRRFCALCSPAATPLRQKKHQPVGTTVDPTDRLDDIVQYLNATQVRATYGAVAALVGGIPRGIGARLTRLYSRSVEASWVVNESSGMPTGYRVDERHPALLSKTDIIISGNELEERMTRWKSKHGRE